MERGEEQRRAGKEEADEQAWPLKHSRSSSSSSSTMADSSPPQWDKLFDVKGKNVLVTGGSRGRSKSCRAEEVVN